MAHRFIVVIPVADRPQHLSNILSSLLQQCHAFSGAASSVEALVADDSADASAMRRHQEIIRNITTQGLATTYFGAQAQADLLATLPSALRENLTAIIGTPETDGFHHKGASVTRNLAALQVWRMSAGDDADNTLVMFVDSDEQFKVRIAGANGRQDDSDLAAIDYFGCLDRIFSGSDVRLLTGKVVGDPPVSPAVMTGNFLADIIQLLQALAAADPAQPCRCHAAPAPRADDAAYHDMAELFGFSPAAAFDYACPLHGSHDHAACLAGFAARLDHFFDGEHPTRVSYYLPDSTGCATQPARTVYTGNYVCTRAALENFIPFAPLKLRMAGPVLGRLVRARMGHRFVSANLPLLHTRTTDGTAEFRPGVERSHANVDLGGELERQYFGDVMLFGMERLIAAGYPDPALPPEILRQALDAAEAGLREKYRAMRELVLHRLGVANRLFDDLACGWAQADSMASTRQQFQRFFANVRHNFDADASGFHRLEDAAHREYRLTAMTWAIMRYPSDCLAWRTALDLMDTPT